MNQPNCGSVFANPPEMAAGRVVELLGMKGEAHGGARVSEVHANFIVAADGATAADVLVLIRRAMRRARDELGITLRTEVQLVGDFGPGEAGEEPGDGAAGDHTPDRREGERDPADQRLRAHRRGSGPEAAAAGRPAHRRAAQGDRRRQGAAAAAHPRLGPGSPSPSPPGSPG